ncbi:DNA-processing protein DprA [Acetobacterium tundrae]|uniref:DNA-protecting protein DprA n=1 Tax=Acetobacterium tundrae TaxID=132932 RepID=A0ABR6WJS7_9FIRM|nr:DNA-processing protein DprA [Acetobacterium tundrae]MBC3796511.1 DNA-protecting protein DprA [Acetobacterium tundrae]
MEEALYWLWFLGLEKITAKQKKIMLERFGSPQNIFSINRELLEKTNIFKKENLDYLERSKSLEKARHSMNYMEDQGIRMITREDPLFPEMLKNIYMPPAGLFVKGDVTLLNSSIKIGIVGSRNPTVLGKRYAKAFAQSLAAVGITIVSGLAAGIDGQSHWGSIDELGRTIGVLGTGIDICYPLSNQKLFDRMSNEALIITEFNLGEKPLPYHFPQRNRIISGLSQGVLVIEARKKSGSLITVNHALEQGKNVYVIPGDISASQWAGGNQLLKEGAKLVTDPKDILEDYVIVNNHSELKTAKKMMASKEKIMINIEEQTLYNLIRKGYTTIDELIIYSELPVNTVNGLLTMMEIEEVIDIKYGNIVLL